MKTDSLFHELFRRWPALVLDQAGLDPAAAPRHAFRSEELKQTAPSLDGLLAPEPDGDDPYVFIEVRQGRLDKRSASGDSRRRVDALRRSRRLEAAISFPAAPDEEIQAMLGFTDIDPGQTRFYQDVFAEGQAEGQTEGRRSEAANLLRRLLIRRFGPAPPSRASKQCSRHWVTIATPMRSRAARARGHSPENGPISCIHHFTPGEYP